MSVWSIIALVVGAVIVTAVITALIVNEKDRRKVEYMIDAFEDGEYNFKFSESRKFNRTLNRIKWIVEKQRQQNEQESWTKLIRVLTHEIMNTVSPIASLSDALSQYLDSHEAGQEMDVKGGLDTISASSKDLIKFVESYRELAGVAKPVKKGLMVSDLIGRVISLTAKQCASYGATCTFTCSTDDLLIYADESQISRVIINLIKNALQADATRIDIMAEIDRQEQTLIHVSNNGAPISLASQEQIFIPFYTTKSDGSGIGLSLSRQIMRAHNGQIDLTRSDETATEFTLIFR